MKMEAAYSSETMVTGYQTVGRHAIVDSNFHVEDFASLFFARDVLHATDRSGISVNVFCSNWVFCIFNWPISRESENYHFKVLLEGKELVEFLKEWAEGAHRNP